MKVQNKMKQFMLTTIIIVSCVLAGIMIYFLKYQKLYWGASWSSLFWGLLSWQGYLYGIFGALFGFLCLDIYYLVKNLDKKRVLLKSFLHGFSVGIVLGWIWSTTRGVYQTLVATYVRCPHGLEWSNVAKETVVWAILSGVCAIIIATVFTFLFKNGLYQKK